MVYSYGSTEFLLVGPHMFLEGQTVDSKVSSFAG